MLDGLTWAALSQQWPWFAAAVAIFLIAIGLLIAVNPKSKQSRLLPLTKTTGNASLRAGRAQEFRSE